ncbi:hypothetical protein UXH81_24020, partial [Escherichia coli]|nr:hypothetical protein [Escherichia coli]
MSNSSDSDQTVQAVRLRFGYANQIRRDRPLTHEELMHYVPGIFGEDKHTSRSQ